MKRDETVRNSLSEGQEITVERRTLFGWFWKLVGLCAVLELGWITTSILRSSGEGGNSGVKSIVDAGMVENFSPGTVTAVPEGQFHLARLEDGSFLALSKSCTHLGCSVPWNESKNSFICPCHGSTFDIQGNVLTPPALRPLDYFPVTVENGLVRVNISKALRREEFLPDQTAQVHHG